MVSIKDVAAKCGVSVATVSKALNDHSDISGATKELVHHAAQELGYRPNSVARALKTNRTFSLGVVYDDGSSLGLSHEYFSGVLDAFKQTAEANGYDVTFINRNIGGHLTSYLEHCHYRGVDGICVVCTANYRDEQISELINGDIPLVTIDYSFHNRTSIISDNVGGMESLVRYVYEKGHRKLGFIHGEDTDVTENRLASFYKTCYALGIDVPEENVLEAKYHDPRSTAECTQALLSRKDRPTCIFFPDDFSYIGGINVIKEAGLKTPEDISCVGYDGIYLSQVLVPKLTTFKQDTVTLGSRAAKCLIDAVEHPKTCIPERILVKGYMLEGQSVQQL
ncbi:MAG: LacI family transcriptional regulator [Faecalibacterium sp.]|jgi:DNA-binding LacI/PurR family transcriptional regulator|nr:LacI family transcriptional regulator [Faecalibacterium sp.]